MFKYRCKLKDRFSAAGLFLCIAFIALFGFACEPSPSMMENSNQQSSPPEVKQTDNLTSLEREIRDMKTVDFQFIYVFKRKDGGVFDAEDKQYIRANRPAEINRFSAADDQKAFIAGSNFDFPAENMENLRKRFVIENYSKPLVVVEQAANNTNQMQNK